jgi:hypothetical protein
MASGEAIGEFSFKAVTSTHTPGPAGGILTQVNWEGTAAGFGAVFATTTYVGGPSRMLRNSSPIGSTACLASV